MFKLESYITPLLMGYLDKYVKLRQEDFQLSLWGGDAVLNNLDLRLDELEKVLQLPVMFQSGHIHELRLHVPWTKLGSEPVVITINTVECILKVRDTAYDGNSSTQSKSQSGRSPQPRPKTKRRSQPTEDLPPGYLQSIVNRIINNVTFIINNLILKFVEDDIVLSVNVKSAECYSVDKEWNRAFVDLTADDLALRKMLNFADLTVCLDKTNSSGHIESYQEPMAYRCAVTCRLHMEYDSVTAKLPNVTRLNVFCDTLNLSLTDTQLPMFVRFIELCIAMYYGSLDIPTSTAGSVAEESTSTVQVEEGAEDEQKYDTSSEFDPSNQGWASWAWSYVPQILPTEEEQEEMDRQMEEQGRRGKPAPLVLSIGFYIHHGTIVFKLTEKSKDNSELPHKKMHFLPFLKLSVDGVGIEVLLQGVIFCSIQCGLTSLRLSTCGNCICDVDDEKVLRCNTLLTGGEDVDNKIGLNYISNSLFDDVSWENRGQRARHIVDGEEHRQIFTEQYALQRFGAFWVDSLYTYEMNDRVPGASSNSSETDNSDAIFLKEFSTLRFVFGNTHLHCSSTLYHRVSRFIHCATHHQYQPYGTAQSSTALTPEERPKPTEEQVKCLEDFIPTTLLHLMFINPTVTVLQSEHPYCDVSKKNYKCRQKKRDNKMPEEHHHPPPIPAVVLSASRFDLQITKPMYPGRLVKMVTSIAGPSSNLLHHCHSHMQIKLFSLQAGLQRANGDGSVSRPLTLLPPCSFALYLRSLVLPKLWTNTSLPLKEWMYEIPNASVNVNKASILMCSRVVSSWLTQTHPHRAESVLDDSLLDDLFPVSGESTHQSYPLLEVGLSGLEFKSCDSTLVNACVGSLSLLHVFLYTPGIGGKMSVIPILYGPSDTSKMSSPDFFLQPKLDKSEVHSDCITATFQKPKHAGASEAQALALLDCQGLCVWLDPGLITWFHYCPQPRPGNKTEQLTVTLDLSLAQMTSPLNAVSQASVHSTSSPSHPGIGRQQTSTSQHQRGKPASVSEGERDKREDAEKETFGQILAQHFPLVRMLHVQLELKPCAVFLPKTGVPNSESSSDILSIVHQARHAGRLSDTLVICLPNIAVTSTMTKPMSVAQELPVRSIQGSLIGEKLPWAVRVSNICVYSLLSGRSDPVFLIHPMDIMSTVAVTCKYNPPTSENISTMALCLHVDVGQPKLDITAAQLHLCVTVFEMAANLASNASKLVGDCSKLFFHKKDVGLLTPKPSYSHKRSVSSTQKIESVRSAEVTENVTTDVSEDFSHEGSPLHENIIQDQEEQGVKLSLWLQLMLPRLQCSLYSTCPLSHQEKGISLVLDHFDLSMDSQNVYSKAKVTLGSLGIQHSIKAPTGIWSWNDPEGIVLSFSRQLPANLHTVTNKIWTTENSAPSPFSQSHETNNRDKKHGVLSVTFTRALCKNVKKRLRKANVELPSVNEMDTLDMSAEPDQLGSLRQDMLELYYHEYLSEFCIKAEPFDVVLKPDVIQMMVGLFSGLGKGERTDKRRQLQPGIIKPEFSSQTETSAFEFTSVHNLPLIYADLGTIRVFLPNLDTAQDVPAGESPPKTLNAQSLSVVNGTSLSTIVTIDNDCAGFQPVNLQYSQPITFQHSKPMDSQHSQPTNLPHSIDGEQKPEPLFTGLPSGGLEGTVPKPPSEVCSTLTHNFLMLQVKSCLLQPHADNPLPRTAQQKEVFLYAVQSGLTHQPGAVIEDRQYQVDVKGVSFSSGVWEDLINEVKLDDLRKPTSGSMVQIPALDWNTFLMDSSAHDKKDIRLIPLATPFDFCLVVAPPITYLPPGDNSEFKKKTQLICGFTCELNLTSDLDLFISTSQIKLLSQITGQISQCFQSRSDTCTGQGHHSSPSPLLASEVGRRKNLQSKVEPAGGFDSGVESDLSTMTLDRGHRVAGLRPPSNQAAPKTERRSLTECGGEQKSGSERKATIMFPIDILVTASRISCTVYTHEILQTKLTLEMPLFRESQPEQSRPENQPIRADLALNARDNLEQMLNSGAAKRNPQNGPTGREDEEAEDSFHLNQTHSVANSFARLISEDSIKRVIPQGSVCAVPFVYVYITQPHCILSSYSSREVKVEGSCYDILIKGASDRHVTAVDDFHVMPDCTDFNVHWLETRPGVPHPYTGIPPSLLTARYVRDLTNPDTISLQLERPLRLKVSRLAVEQVTSFTGHIVEMFPSPEVSEDVGPGCGDREPKPMTRREGPKDLLSFAERLEVASAQVVIVLEMSDSVGAVLSVEGMTLEADVSKEHSDNTPSMTGHLQLKDIVAKVNYERKCRPLIGPFSLNLDAGLTWIPVSVDQVLSQILVVVETNLIPVSFGQEHLFCLTEMSQQMDRTLRGLWGSKPTEPIKVSAERVTDSRPESAKTSADFVQDKTHDDLRSGGFQFIDGAENSSLLPNANEIIFSGGSEEANDNSCMTWCYQRPRVITALHLMPVPFYLSSSTQSLDSSVAESPPVPCVLQYWDELREDFIDVVSFHLCESEQVTVDLPEPRRSNSSVLVTAKTWRVALLQFAQEQGLTKRSHDMAVLPASLAACMCVDSAFIPSIIPTVQFSVSVPAAELNLCHHMHYNGTDVPSKLSLYHMSSDLVDQKVFATARLRDVSCTMSHLEARSNLKVSAMTSLDVLEYGHLTMDQVVEPAALNLTASIIHNGYKQDIIAFVESEKLKLKVGKSTVHTLNMAASAWTTFSPSCAGPLLIFNHYIVCNNTSSTIRFGQAGTDENIVLHPREMHGYSWRTYTCPQFLHLCMDKPTWKWTEPFPVDKEGSSVHNVTARDQSYVVIVKIRQLSALQIQVTVCGQLVVCNRLSQPISMRLCPGVITKSKVPSAAAQGEAQHYIIQPGEHLPSLTSNDAMLNPVQFRLAGFSTSWSHEVFLSGDRMKDNQMLKISLPEGNSYFHIWCRVFCQHYYSIQQKMGLYHTATLRMIMLAPLYVVRTHLPRPLYIHLNSPKQKQEMMVKSQGREFQLHCTGGDVTHQMAFRLGSDMLLSDPAVVLSTGLIGQLTRTEVTNIDIDSLVEQRLDVIHSQWPYLTEEKEKELDIDSVISTKQVCHLDPADLISRIDPVTAETLEPQPSIDLNVHLSEYIIGCDTLLVEVAPVFLVHNGTDLEVLITGNEGREWCIQAGHTMAPPLIKHEFRLSIKFHNILSGQKVIPMSGESQDYRRYNDDIGKVLFVDGYVHVAFPVVLQESHSTEVVFVTVTSDIRHDIRVICIRERYVLSNQTGMDLTTRLLALPLSPNPILMSETESVTVVSPGEPHQLKGDKSDHNAAEANRGCAPLPLFRWTTVVEEESDVEEASAGGMDVATYVCYLSFATASEETVSLSSSWKWSVPVRIVSSKDGHRCTTSIPCHDRIEDCPLEARMRDAASQTSVTRAVCVSTQLVKGVTYVVVSSDPAPVCVVENLCPFPIQYGQTCDKLIGNGAIIQEQVELVGDLPWLPPGGWGHYTPPSVNTEFVARETISIPRLHFRAKDMLILGTDQTGPSEWSSATQISGNMDAFVRLPGFCDLKVMIEMVGMVVHLIVRPVSKAEITAKEIRSRLTDHEEVKAKSQGDNSGTFGGTLISWNPQTTSTPDHSDPLSMSSTKVAADSSLKSPPGPPSSKISLLSSPYIRFSERQRWARQNISRQSLTLGVLCQALTLAIQDETGQETLSDLMCLHVGDFFFASYPVSRSPETIGTETCYAISANGVQIDNQHYGDGLYDFPVVFLPQNKTDDHDKNPVLTPYTSDQISVVELHAILRSRSFLHLQIVSYSDCIWRQSTIDSVDVSVKPFSLHIDDTFIYRLVQEFESFSPSRLGSTPEIVFQTPGVLNRKLPVVVKLNSYTLSQPIRIKHFTIQPIKMLLSVHASLKLFLASDHTPLNVGKFERVCVYSTLPRLGHALAMHYASAAIFRAGIVVGSLEILGNPTGLVRSISAGVSDLVSLPYSGLTRGPGAFVSGLSRGVGSLVKNVSAGMITSVTNFASSVSRNMDRLSFDSTHQERQEENRKNRPVGVSDGLKQGLTGFGLSLLGAVAGLADQPIQTLLSSGAPDERRPSAASTASGFVAGMGKGLVGVFTKPIGGAAEFVSQTGQGILHGTGLGQLPSRLEKAVVQRRQDLPDSSLKYSVKIFSNLPCPDLLLAAPALSFDIMGAEVKVVLLLTPDVLLVINVEEDAQQQALSLSELECKTNYEEPGRLVLQWVDHMYSSSSLESQSSNKDRVAAFIDTQKFTDQLTESFLPPMSQSEPGTQSDSQPEPQIVSQSSKVPGAGTQSQSKASNDPASVLPQYQFEMDPHTQDLFVTLLRLAKNKLQGRGFPI